MLLPWQIWLLQSTDHLHKNMLLSVCNGNHITGLMLYPSRLASNLWCGNPWQPVHLPQCSATHVPKQHMCNLHTQQVQQSLLAINGPKKNLSGIAGWAGSSPEEREVYASCFESACMQINTEYLLSARAL